MKSKAPPYHVWDQIEPGLWKCQWCPGWLASKSEPPREARAVSEERARGDLSACCAQGKTP